MAAEIALFDLGHVVLDWEPSRLYTKIFDTPQECDVFLSDVCTMAWHTRHDAGVSFADNAAELIRLYPHYEAEILAWGRRWMEMFDGYVEGTAELIRRLDARQVPLYALTNVPADPWDEMLQEFEILRRFRDVIVSGRIGLIKPGAEIYHVALEVMDHPEPANVLFIDNSLPNVEAADALGFRTHHFKHAEGLETALLCEGLL